MITEARKADDKDKFIESLVQKIDINALSIILEKLADNLPPIDKDFKHKIKDNSRKLQEARNSARTPLTKTEELQKTLNALNNPEFS